MSAQMRDAFGGEKQFAMHPTQSEVSQTENLTQRKRGYLHTWPLQMLTLPPWPAPKPDNAERM